MTNMDQRRVVLTDYTYLSSVKSLCEIVCKSGKQYDLVIGISRGGLIPAVFMSHALNRPMGIVHCSSYSDTSKGELETHGWVSPVQSPESILIVDDLSYLRPNTFIPALLRSEFPYTSIFLTQRRAPNDFHSECSSLSISVSNLMVRVLSSP